MKKQLPVGLVIEGNATNSSVLNLPALSEELGPIKSVALRVARRHSNALRAGYAVPEYEGLQGTQLILLRLPDASVARVVDELSTSELVFSQLSFVLCETWLSADALQLLSSKGAAVGTLVELPTAKRGWFALEGDNRAVRSARRFLERRGVRVVEVKSHLKHVLFASTILTTALPLPLYAAAQEALRACGLSGNVLSDALEQLLQKTLRDFLKSPRVSYGSIMPADLSPTRQQYLEQLRNDYPELASFIDEHVTSARQLLTREKANKELAQGFSASASE
jgi:Domain of unknown function (DUF2520)